MSDNPQHFSSRKESIGSIMVKIHSFQLGKDFYCAINNIDPGAVIARGRGSSRETAEFQAIEKARAAVN